MSETRPDASAANGLSGRTTIVVGASRGLGRGVATALARAGASVIAVARTTPPASSLATGAGKIQAVLADAGDPTSAGRLLGRYEPDTVVLVAGARPHTRPLQDQTWETFSVNWETDVRIAFLWLREALLKPLRPGSRVVVFSSGAASRGRRSAAGTPAPRPPSGFSRHTRRTRRDAPIWTSPSQRCSPGSRHTPIWGAQRSRRTQLVTASPSMTTSGPWANP